MSSNPYIPHKMEAFNNGTPKNVKWVGDGWVGWCKQYFTFDIDLHPTFPHHFFVEYIIPICEQHNQLHDSINQECALVKINISAS